MRLGTLLIAGLALAGCKKKDEAKPATGSAGAPVAAGSGSAGSASGSGLAFDTAATDPDSPDAMPIAFENKVPRLPAISADGTLFADYDSDVIGEPVPPFPMQVVLRKVNDDTVVEHLTILDLDESTAANEKGRNWLTADLTQKLKDRAAAVLKRLAGFRSLEAVHLEQTDEGDVKPTKIGDLVLASDSSDNGIGVELRDAHGRVLQRAELAPYSTGDDMTGCGYTPRLTDAYRDPPSNTIYLELGFHFRDDCDRPPTNLFAWSADPAKGDPAAAAHGVVAQQLAAAVTEAPAVTNNLLATTSALAAFTTKAKPIAASDVAVTMARDGKSAWGSARGNTKGKEMWRASDLLVQTPQGWQLAAVAWTEPKDNAAVNRDAKGGKLTAGKLAGDPGDQALRDAFAKLTTDGLPSARKDLVAIGSGPDERTVDGPAFAKAWNAVWKGKTTIVSSVAHATPSGTTGWVAATVELQKSGYKVPFTVFAVFEKDTAGAWTLATIHFAV